MSPLYSGHLASHLLGTATLLRLQPDTAPLVAALAAPASVVMTLFNASYNEQVLVTGTTTVAGVPYFVVQRGFNGTVARDWVFDTCVCTTLVIPGPVCADPAKGSDCCGLPLDGVQEGRCFSIDKTNPAAPVLGLRPTGVVPGDYCGFHVNECGLVTHIDANWPASCLPAFNPCSSCCGTDAAGGGGAGGNTSLEVGFVPRPGAVYALGPTYQAAVDQLDLALAQCCQNTVQSVTAGGGLSATGSLSNVTLSLSTVGLPGVYGGFTVNPYGQVVSYTPPPVAPPQVHTATLPARATYDAMNDTYTHSVDLATTGSPGVVELAIASELSAGTAAANDVITAGNFAAAFDAKIPAVTTGAGLTATAGPLTTARTIQLDYNTLPTGALVGPNARFALVDGINHSVVSRETLSRDLGASYAMVEFAYPSMTISAQRNIASVARTSMGVFLITMTSGVPSTYHAISTPHDPAAPMVTTYKRYSATVFEVRAYGLGGAPIDPAVLSVNVFALD